MGDSYSKLRKVNLDLADLIVKEMREAGKTDAEIVVALRERFVKSDTITDAISKALESPKGVVEDSGRSRLPQGRGDWSPSFKSATNPTSLDRRLNPRRNAHATAADLAKARQEERHQENLAEAKRRTEHR